MKFVRTSLRFMFALQTYVFIAQGVAQLTPVRVRGGLLYSVRLLCTSD